MHALPLTYGKDMQEDKEPLFDAIDTIELCLDATEGMLAGIEFDRERLEAASGDEMLAATEVADLLVRKGVPFREAHGIVGGLVRDAVEQRQGALRADAGGAARSAPSTSTTSYYEVLRAQQLAGVEADRGRHRLGAARRADRAAPRETLAAVKARVARRAGMSVTAPLAERARSSAGDVLRPLGPRRRPRADRLPALLRRAAAARSSRPRATSATIPPATPTSA